MVLVAVLYWYSYIPSSGVGDPRARRWLRRSEPGLGPASAINLSPRFQDVSVSFWTPSKRVGLFIPISRLSKSSRAPKQGLQSCTSIQTKAGDARENTTAVQILPEDTVAYAMTTQMVAPKSLRFSPSPRSLSTLRAFQPWPTRHPQLLHARHSDLLVDVHHCQRYLLPLLYPTRRTARVVAQHPLKPRARSDPIHSEVKRYRGLYALKRPSSSVLDSNLGAKL